MLWSIVGIISRRLLVSPKTSHEQVTNFANYAKYLNYVNIQFLLRDYKKGAGCALERYISFFRSEGKYSMTK